MAARASFGIDAQGWTQFARSVRKANKDAQKLLLVQIKSAMQPISNLIKQEASWSSRIPQTVRISATNKGVAIRAGGRGAPHAYAFEHHGITGEFRHPVFGNRAVWVSQPARPFLTPVAKANESKLADAMLKAVDQWTREIGFK
jgi:hypothetical protein